MNAGRDNAGLDLLRAQTFSNRARWAVPVVLAALVLWGTPLYAILAGAALSIAVNRPLWPASSTYGKLALQSAIVLLGFNLDAQSMWEVSQGYAAPIALYVLLTFGAGIALGYFLRVDAILTRLMAAGTAICGGTAIAALSPIIKARGDQMAVALTIVFFLNMIALLVFPLVGERLEMTQVQFGLWSALAVHDTSSVVAVAAAYGEQAAEVATTLKLGRTLWLIPLILGFSLLHGSKGARIRIPGFIFLFILASIAGSVMREYFAVSQTLLDGVKYTSSALIVVALFFIGLECTRATFRNLRGRVVLLAVALWIMVVPLTLAAALYLA